MSYLEQVSGQEWERQKYVCIYIHTLIYSFRKRKFQVNISIPRIFIANKRRNEQSGEWIRLVKCFPATIGCDFEMKKRWKLLDTFLQVSHLSIFAYILRGI